MTGNMSLFVLIGTSLYLVMMLLVGWWSSGRISNLSDFLVAGRRLPFYLATATLFATWFGAGPCMGSSGTAYEKGLMGVISDPFAAGLSLILAGLFYVALMRRLNLLTVTDIFGRYYSKGSEVFASALMVPVYVGWLGSQLVALGYIFHAFTGMNTVVGILIGTAIVLVYTTAGGMWAVTLTDLMQVVVLCAGFFVIFPQVIGEVGGMSSLVAQTPKEFWRIIPEGIHGASGWFPYVGQWALMGLGCIVGQDLVQRSLASKNEAVAKTSAVTAGLAYIAIGIIPILLGFSARIILGKVNDAELVVPLLAMKFLPPLMLTLFLGALVSAIMSSADSSLLAGTSLVTNNIIRAFRPHISERGLLRTARVTTVVLTVLSMLLALYVKEIYALMVNSWATLLVGLFVPITAALYWKKANKGAAWASMILGTGTWIGYIWIKGGSLGNDDDIFYTAATLGGLASLASYLFVTFVRYAKIPEIKPASAAGHVLEGIPREEPELAEVK